MATTLSSPSASAKTASPLANALNLYKKGYLQFMTDVWQTQGDLALINLGPIKMVLIVHPDLVKYVTIDHAANFDKRAAYEPTRKLLLGNGLVTSVGETWRRQRKLMAPFFTPRGIQQYGTIMLEEAQTFARRWELKAHADEPVEMLDEMMQLTASIILKTMFSLQTDTEVGNLQDSVTTLIETVSNLQVSLLRVPMWIPTPVHQRYHLARKRTHEFIRTIIARRRAMSEAHWPHDLLSQLMSTPDEETGHYMSDQQLLDECITIFFAGHETTARTLAFTWYALSQNADVEARFHAEIAAVLGNRTPTIDDLKQMAYTIQIIHESLRLYPAAPMYARDVVQDDVINGRRIPAGSVMMLMSYFTHRHPDFWPDPERFDPDRWRPELAKSRHPYAYHPFAAGQRICIGNHFSLFESQILLAVLGQRFAPRMLPGHQPQIEMAGTLTSKNGIHMTLDPRQH
jgi:cytochrome P450